VTGAMSEHRALTTLAGPPAAFTLYRKAVLHRGSGGSEPPDVRLQLSDQPIETGRLWQYQRLCGFGVSDRLPPTYLHLLAFPLGMALMTEPRFPFPLLGLVHVSNTIAQHRPVRADERVTVRAWVAELRPHPAGRVVDLVSEALVHGEPVWQETSSYLHREAVKEAVERDRSKTDRERVEPPNGPVIRWQAPAGIGRRYAAVSGDRNPIHLHALTAKAFGFRGAIAHGMWLKARTLAAFASRLPDRLQVEVAFKTPVFLPSTVEMRAVSQADGRRFEVRNARSGKPHLSGTISG